MASRCQSWCLRRTSVVSAVVADSGFRSVSLCDKRRYAEGVGAPDKGLEPCGLRRRRPTLYPALSYGHIP